MRKTKNVEALRGSLLNQCLLTYLGWAGTPLLPPSLQPWEAEVADTSKQIRTPHVHKESYSRPRVKSRVLEMFSVRLLMQLKKLRWLDTSYCYKQLNRKVTERNSFVEEVKLERERQQKGSHVC